MVEKKITKPSRVPKFKTVEEENAFWEKHDLYEFLDEFKPSNLKLPPKEEYTMRVPVDPSVSDLLYQLAQELGVDHTLLAGDWIVERLQAELAAREKSRTRG